MVKKNYSELSVKVHKQNKGKISISNKVKINNYEDLSVAYTPGVAQPCLEIQKDPSKYKDLVMNGKCVAVITDGSSVLGLGNIGPKAAMPVMEGKAALFKKFGGIDAFPIALNTQDTEEIIKSVQAIASSFGGINLEDISAPRCFEIEERLNKLLDIPVFHDDQHGTAIVVLAGVINALKISKRKVEKCKVVVNGSGAAGVAITKLLVDYGFKDILVCDSRGIISKDRTNLNDTKKDLLRVTNKKNANGKLDDALKDADIFIGVSKEGALHGENICFMKKNPIIFALANPEPEICPAEARKYGAKIIATGRSDFPNQVNNVLVFPGIFKGALEAGVEEITTQMQLDAAQALAKLVKNPTENKFLPKVFQNGVAEAVSCAVIRGVKKRN